MRTLPAAIAAFLIAAPAFAAERNYSVTSFDRVRIDGPYKVRLKTNVSPFARASGAQTALDGVSIKVEGRTLIVRADSGGTWGGYPGQSRGPVAIEVGTHDLTSAWVNGAGALAIDQARGLAFELSVQGAGTARIDSVDIDQLKVWLTGTANSRLAGRAGKLTTSVRGTSSLDARSLDVRDAVITAEGPTTVSASVSGTAKVDALGLASVVLAGGPSCDLKTRGSATVDGCKPQ